MPDNTSSTPPAAPATSDLDASTYEIIRQRLKTHAGELRTRLETLNQARKEVFGSIDVALVGADRITTANNCMPRDMVAVGNRFLFGYNVQFGLKTDVQLADVFSLYEYRDKAFHLQPLAAIADARFERDFKEIYRYYKDAVFAKFFRHGPHLFMVFRVGKTAADIKAFKWTVDGDRLIYLDNRSEFEVRFPPQHEFEWTRTHRDLHRHGLHPHISIEERVFVETVGGDLTIKVENNTASGEGIYAEPVDNKDQTLDDAEIYYSIVGNLILLRVRPFQERDFRYLVFNEKTKQVRRIDSLSHACVLLPEGHGLIFPDGYYLQSGEFKQFEMTDRGMAFERRIASPNGEDFLFVFYRPDSGGYVLLSYNMIDMQVATPNHCAGYTFFPNGEMICFQSPTEPQKHHAIQIWQTPYVHEDFVPHAKSDSPLFKIGNRDIVRAMAECHETLALIDKDDSYANLYLDLVKLTTGVLDSYHWLEKMDAANLRQPLTEIRAAATAAVDQFDKVLRVKRTTADQTAQAQQRVREIISTAARRRFENVNEYVSSLGDLRRVRGNVIALRDLRYVDLAVVAALEKEVGGQSDQLARRCVDFLIHPESLVPYQQRVETEITRIETLTKAADAKKLDADIAACGTELELLIDIVSNLKIDDATQRTAITDRISDIFARVNQGRAGLKRKLKELLSVEGVAEFNSRMKLLNQGIVSFLEVCDTPEKCEELLGKVMIQLEELEGQFAEFDEFIVQLTDKRAEVYNAFETRKVAMIEARNKRATTLMSAVDRILKGIKSRVDAFTSVNDIHGYFASDLMIEKVRDIVEQLRQLGDTVKVDDIQSRLKTLREDAVRQLKDRQELFSDGDMVIKLGQHRFSVNVQPLELTTVLRDGVFNLHLTGTKYFQRLDNPELLAARDLWEQECVSESRAVYRGEFLAHAIAESNASPNDLLALDNAARLAFVQQFMGPRYAEAYVKGVHDHDAAKLLAALLEMKTTLGLLRFPPAARALAIIGWSQFVDKKRKTTLAARLQGIGRLHQLFPAATARGPYVAELRDLLREFVAAEQLFDEAQLENAANYLCHELCDGEKFLASPTAIAIVRGFDEHLKQTNFTASFGDSIRAVQKDTAGCFRLLRDWLAAFAQSQRDADDWEYADEAAALMLFAPNHDAASVGASTRVANGNPSQEVAGLVGSHPTITDGRYRLNYNQFTQKLANYTRDVVPRFLRLVERKKELLAAAKGKLRLDEFRPRVLTSFVRNRLIDTVYLPLIGDNLAKQIGVVGEQKRTDRMGLLLLLSPPGYGKTTLLEYIANRLGIVFMKINGPAIGNRVTSLDPAEAPNAAAREELAKLNLALEMGDNVLICVDDIQHCHAEFLQKFISLCDAQRKIEGVHNGQTRTYDLRGRKVAVAMAGNPYTESGQKFKIPDMLANRADVYNLGEIIGDAAEVFESSYLENCATSNPTLAKLAARSPHDLHAIIDMAKQEHRAAVELEGNFSLEEINEFVAVMKKLIRVRDVVLAVNREYIRSAAQSDDYRTEPPFKLQGSYRNMNRIAEKVSSIMNDRELEVLILSNYENDAQTLTADAEANLLKLKTMLGTPTETERQRWSDIQRTFQQNVKLRGLAPDNQFGQVVAQLMAFRDGLNEIRTALEDGVSSLLDPTFVAQAAERHVSSFVEQVGKLHESLEQKVLVQHNVPRNVLTVLTSQFELMQNWLAPLTKTVQIQSDDLRRLDQSIQQCLDQYSTLLAELRVAESRKPPIA